tara:strand:+ start:579 stop:767 length:189 start_codon:yes stop_codon:yes gene_type:complete
MEFDRHTFYIVCSYGMLALAALIEIWAVRRRRRQALRQASITAALTDGNPARPGATTLQEAR